MSTDRIKPSAPPTRQVQLHYHEEVIREAHAAQRTPERGLYEAVASQGEGGTQISEVLRLHGLRQGRYFGLKDRSASCYEGDDGERQEVVTLTEDDAELADALREELAA